MPLFNPFGNSYLDPFTRRQAQVIVDGDDLTPQQHGDVQRLYAKFKLQQNAAVTRYAIHNATLTDGTTVRIVSNYGHDQVFVKPPVTVEHKKFTGVWVLISLYSETSTVIGNSVPSDPDRRNTGRYRSLLYKIPGSMKASEAKLMYSGETSVDYTTLYALAPADVNGPVSSYISSMTGSVADTEGEIGFVSTFAPYKGAAMFVALRSSQTKSASTKYDGTSTTTRTGKVWDGESTTKTYTANYTGVGVGPASAPHTTTSTRGGEIIASPPRMVANGQLNYKVRVLAGTYGNGNADPTRFEKFMVNDGASVDANGIDPVAQTGTPPDGFTRREIGYMDQSPKYFLTKTSPFQVRTRSNAVKRAIPASGPYESPVFYDDGLFFRMPSDDRTKREVSLVTNAGKQVLSLNMRDLPGLTEDALFAAIDSAISAGTSLSVGAGSNIYIDEIGFGDFHPSPIDPLNSYLSGGDAPRRFAWSMSTSTTNPVYGGTLDTSNIAIQVTLIPDQDIYKWEDEA